MATATADFLSLYIDEEIQGRVTEEIEEHDVESCRQLYLSIIELAVNDYRFLQRMTRQERKSRYDRKKLRQMTEDGDPREFFNSRWFEEVCNYVGVKPQLIRERLENEDADLIAELVA
jgi:hypothetical protein